MSAAVDMPLAVIDGMMEDGDAIPEPSALDVVVGLDDYKLDDYKDAVAVLVVKAPDDAAPAVRVNATIPDQTLKRIDRYAAKHGLTRSGFLVQAAKKEMEANAS